MLGEKKVATKAGRQNRHRRRLKTKIARFKNRGWKTEGLEKALRISTGEESQPGFKTGQEADSRFKRNK